MRLLQEVCSTSERKEITPELIKSYALLLFDLRQDQIEYGCKEAAKNSLFFPAVAQIRQYAEAMPAPAEVQERVEGGYRNMVEAYKQKHREEMSNRPVSVLEMPDDPRKALEAAIERAAAVKAMDAPGKTLHEQHRAIALERLGGTTMPLPIEIRGTVESPEITPRVFEANKAWAHDMAVKNGWIKPREAGEEG